PTTSGASISSWAGTPTPRSRSGPRTSFRASRPCWAKTPASSSNGPASTPLPACAWTASCTAGSSLPATVPTGCRRSVPAAPTAGCRTQRTWPGSSTGCSRAGPGARCSTATGPSASTRPTRTSATRPGPPTSSPPRARSAACSAMRRWIWRGSMNLPGASSTAGGCRCRRCCTGRRSTPPIPTLSMHGRCPALCCSMPRWCGRAVPAGCCASWAPISRCWCSARPRSGRKACRMCRCCASAPICRMCRA
ncbi:hypothetical protein KXX11_003235, partial [Aspergillus fumigatus]